MDSSQRSTVTLTSANASASQYHVTGYPIALAEARRAKAADHFQQRGSCHSTSRRTKMFAIIRVTCACHSWEDCTSRKIGTRKWRKSGRPYPGRQGQAVIFFAGGAGEEDGGVVNYFQRSYSRSTTIDEAFTSSKRSDNYTMMFKQSKPRTLMTLISMRKSTLFG